MPQFRRTILPHPAKGRPLRRRVILFNKPFRVLCQFRRLDERLTLGDFIKVPGVYPAGRLDYDSEGLVVLTNDGGLQHHLTAPSAKSEKIYWAQVEGTPTDRSLEALALGVIVDGQRTLPARVREAQEPAWLWPRDPSIRVRHKIPTTWLELRLKEGRNRQVRKMTAAIGHPTLRLLRTASGHFRLNSLAPGEWVEVKASKLVKQQA